MLILVNKAPRKGGAPNEGTAMTRNNISSTDREALIDQAFAAATCWSIICAGWVMVGLIGFVRLV
jgi:hypothetical protein